MLRGTSHAGSRYFAAMTVRPSDIKQRVLANLRDDVDGPDDRAAIGRQRKSGAVCRRQAAGGHAERRNGRRAHHLRCSFLNIWSSFASTLTTSLSAALAVSEASLAAPKDLSALACARAAPACACLAAAPAPFALAAAASAVCCAFAVAPLKASTCD